MKIYAMEEICRILIDMYLVSTCWHAYAFWKANNGFVNTRKLIVGVKSSIYLLVVDLRQFFFLILCSYFILLLRFLKC